MNNLILTPTDVLMMGDARPMEGSLTGHTLPWPTPDLVAHALRAALHRSGLDAHRHFHHPRGQARIMNRGDADRTAMFGSVLHAGPFPVQHTKDGEMWYFPCPLDVERAATVPTRLPNPQAAGSSSLPAPLLFTVPNLCAQSKENRAPDWLSADDWKEYVKNSGSVDAIPPTSSDKKGVLNSQIADRELHYGIAGNDETGTVQEHKFYSAESLRLRSGWSMGSWVSSSEKTADGGREDVVQKLFAKERHIVVGGQQRLCTAALSKDVNGLPLPGIPQLHADSDGKVRVKWVLITPAIWSRHGEHPGGWLPSWVHADTGRVLLKGGDRKRQAGERRDEWRARLNSMDNAINATLVAAVVGKPVPVSGYATPGRSDGDSGPKSTHAATPAGSVYYFECASVEDARQLCEALHCTASPTLTRRSELLGEQGYGLGVCAPWHPAPTTPPSNP